MTYLICFIVLSFVLYLTYQVYQPCETDDTNYRVVKRNGLYYVQQRKDDIWNDIIKSYVESRDEGVVTYVSYTDIKSAIAYAKTCSEEEKRLKKDKVEKVIGYY